ncbi:hypothetical protein COV18_03070 [Candidatus Woesearchaeota archaeon CG10_big_fil_rev_8_21_14_0_10_37_12]|nr:MAG: hypothetical protein COV18_03070 [Candidatus Woesearchaeota archaeon CG10_big_fil_rev_8_21_14_0_10_37_12]
MTGILTLIAGPSGVGKTSIIERGHPLIKPNPISYRVTTRTIREHRGEIDTRAYHPEKAPRAHGYFITEEEFSTLVGQNALVGVRLYPDPATGAWYGFPKQTMLSALRAGHSISEQVAEYKPIPEVAAYFRSEGIPVQTVLNLSSLAEIVKRLHARSSGNEDITPRIERVKNDVAELLAHWNEFNNIFYNIPTVIYGETAEAVGEKILAKLAAGELPDELYDDRYGFLQLIHALCPDPEEKLNITNAFYLARRGTGDYLVRNHFLHDPVIGSDLAKIVSMCIDTPETVKATYVPFLGMSLLHEELGSPDKALEELINLERAILTSAQGGLVNERYAIALDCLFNNWTVVSQDLQRGLSSQDRNIAQRIDELKSAEIESALCEHGLRRAVKSLNRYLLLKKGRLEGKQRSRLLTPTEAADAVLFNCGIEQKLLDSLIDQYEHANASSDILNDIRQRRAHIDREIDRWSQYKVHVTEEATEENITLSSNSMAELMIFTSLERQVDFYTLLIESLGRTFWSGPIRIPIDKTEHKAIKRFRPLVEYCQDPFLPDHTLTSLCLFELGDALADANELYIMIENGGSDQRIPPKHCFKFKSDRELFQRYWRTDVPPVKTTCAYVTEKLNELTSTLEPDQRPGYLSFEKKDIEKSTRSRFWARIKGKFFREKNE